MAEARPPHFYPVDCSVEVDYTRVSGQSVLVTGGSVNYAADPEHGLTMTRQQWAGSSIRGGIQKCRVRNLGEPAMDEHS